MRARIHFDLKVPFLFPDQLHLLLLSTPVDVEQRALVYEGWFPHPQPDIPVVGRFRLFLDAWRNLPAPPTILSIIEFGYSPRLEALSNADWTQSEGWIQYPTPEPHLHQFLLDTAAEWTRIGALRPAQHLWYPPRNAGGAGAPTSELFIHPTFVVEHPKNRLISDLRSANRRVEKIHFQMETWTDLLQLLPQFSYAIQMDIADAYLHVNIHPRDRRLLLVEILGKLFEPIALMFGVAAAPRIWTKTMKVPISILRHQGVVVFVYIDDLLVLGTTAEECVRSAILTIRLLQSLGFLFKWKKCNLRPSQQVTHLGLDIDFVNQQIRVPPVKLEKLRLRLHAARKQAWLSLHRVASLLGYVQSLTSALLNVRAFTRHLQTEMNNALAANGSRYNPNLRVSMTEAVRQEISFLLEHLREWNGTTFMPSTHDRELFTDASDSGWGANMIVNNQVLRARRPWILSDFEMLRQFPKADISYALAGHCPLTDIVHINILESLTVLLALREFTRIHGPGLWESVKKILLRSDNITTIVYVNKHGGSRVTAINSIVQEILKFLQDLGGITLRAEHIPGVENVLADADSRLPFQRSPKLEFQLNPRLFTQINQIFGPHTIDLMASGVNTQLPRFASWGPETGAVSFDAFLLDWSTENAWVNPPWFLLPRILARIRNQRATVTIVAPIWPTQLWYPTLLRMLIDLPIRLPLLQSTFLLPVEADPTNSVPWQKAAVWRASGIDSLCKEFRTGLSDSSSTTAFGHQPGIITNSLGIDGSAGAVNGITIPWSPTQFAL